MEEEEEEEEHEEDGARKREEGTQNTQRRSPDLRWFALPCLFPLVLTRSSADVSPPCDIPRPPPCLQSKEELDGKVSEMLREAEKTNGKLGRADKNRLRKEFTRRILEESGGDVELVD